MVARCMRSLWHASRKWLVKLCHFLSIDSWSASLVDRYSIGHHSGPRSASEQSDRCSSERHQEGQWDSSLVKAKQDPRRGLRFRRFETGRQKIPWESDIEKNQTYAWFFRVTNPDWKLKKWILKSWFLWSWTILIDLENMILIDLDRYWKHDIDFSRHLRFQSQAYGLLFITTARAESETVKLVKLLSGRSLCFLSSICSYRISVGVAFFQAYQRILLSLSWKLRMYLFIKDLLSLQALVPWLQLCAKSATYPMNDSCL